MFSRFLLFFGAAGAGLCAAATGLRAGRGASLPANPCSFVDGHHVFGVKGAAGISSHQYKSQKEKIDDGTSGQSVPSSISTDFNRNSWN